jgi:hypothetical protein
MYPIKYGVPDVEPFLYVRTIIDTQINNFSYNTAITASDENPLLASQSILDHLDLLQQ